MSVSPNIEKKYILFSESAFQAASLPVDLNNPQYFEVRVFKHPSELFALVSGLNPGALVLDLGQPEFSDFDLRDFIQKIRFSSDPSKEVVPIMAILPADKQSQMHDYYAMGINAILIQPITKETVWEMIEVILGQRIRKYERKKIEFPVTLTDPNGTQWAGVGGNINLEYLLIPGKHLPPQGTNIRIQGSESDLPDFDVWSHCWRNFNDVVLLRFLNPSRNFLLAIEQLPLTPEKNLNIDPEVLEEIKNAPPLALFHDPSSFLPIDLDIIFPEVVSWMSGDKKEPEAWSSFLLTIPENAKNTFTSSDPIQQALAKNYLFAFLLENQLNQICQTQTNTNPGYLEDLWKIIRSHKEQVQFLTQSIQPLLLQSASENNFKVLNHLNRLKSLLKKYVQKMEQTLDQKIEISKT